MSLLLETLKAVEGTVLHVNYHQARLEYALSYLGLTAHYDLSALLNPPSWGIYRCRVLYDAKNIDITYLPYHKQHVSSLQLIETDTINYNLKYADRSALDALFQQRGRCDDVAIVTNGNLTDTTRANIALFDGMRWYTPKEPLLLGTTRQRLLDLGTIIEKTIPLHTIKNYKKTAIFNAMLGFVELEDGIIF